MRIGELARRTGISERALRYYEEQGLLRPARRPSGYRDYDEGAVDTVRDIRTLLAAGLPTALIAELLPCMVNGTAGLAPGCPELVPYLEKERDRISAAIDDLARTRSLLNAIIAATPPENPNPPVCDREPAVELATR
ncbi:MerR family transcriptional regulator [Goodfellowiella coeruleoviolacea]|uniref:DNA-binding transcriptional regulator, MerR family n=1 Tax=Goodfellowiella coeruleoviolacea TaxID=334858 RepID=A0AAE3GLQ8_9PSEU|nr:MerR family transcriptional regulator [Goodfellowiella coeruleoviolacea]MCP2169812.1 DNA-binding transcriptional regulator, MerR family [Goodfellowiella coeruleoviolacea]